VSPLAEPRILMRVRKKGNKTSGPLEGGDEADIKHECDTPKRKIQFRAKRVHTEAASAHQGYKA